MTQQTLQERIERAQSQTMDVTLVEEDPVIVQSSREGSDQVHTQVLDAVHCSCQDATYRNVICRHLLGILMDDGHLGDVAREAVLDKRDELVSEYGTISERMERLERRKDSVQEERKMLSSVIEELDTMQHYREETFEEVVEALSEASSGNGGGGE